MKIHLHFRPCLIAIISLITCRNLPSIAQAPLKLTSAVHPFNTPRGGFQGRPAEFEANPGDTLAAAANGPNATWYNGGVNKISCSLLLPGETWLATEFGMKRLDLKARTVRHYTTLNGLPHDKITALAPVGNTIVCASVSADKAAICRLDQATGTWKTLAEDRINIGFERKPVYWGELPGAPHQLIATSPSSVCLIPGDGLPGKNVALIYRISDGNIEHIASPTFVTKPYTPKTAQLDGDNLWIGADIGLLHYSLTSHRWDSLLTDKSIYGSTRAGDDSLWILTRSVEPYHLQLDQGTVRTEHWAAVHIAGNRVVRSYLLIDTTSYKGALSEEYLENITLADGKVWLTKHGFPGYNMADPALPKVYSLDSSSGVVTCETDPKLRTNAAGLTSYEYSNSVYQALPAAVLANSHTGHGLLTPIALPDRFQGWLCATEERESKMLAGAPGIAYPGFSNTGWAINRGASNSDNRQLLRRNPAGAESYQPGPATLSVHETAAWPVSIGGKVYFLTDSAVPEIRSWDSKTGVVESMPTISAAIRKYQSPFFNKCSMRAGVGALWILSGDNLLHCDLATGSISMFAGSHDPNPYGPDYVLLSVNGDTAWLKGTRNELYKAVAGSTAGLTLVPVPALPNPPESQHNKIYLIAMEDNIAWFSAPAANPTNGRTLIGYNVASQKWTKQIDAPIALSGSELLRPIYKQGAICWFTSNSIRPTAFGYDSQTARWLSLPARLPTSNTKSSTTSLTLMSRPLESFSQYQIGRATGLWSSDELPFKFETFNDEHTAISGRRLYSASWDGLWVFDVDTSKLEQSPTVKVNSNALNFRVMDYSSVAVWMVAGVGTSTFAARFDIQTHIWRYWSEQDGVPQRFDKMIADGQSCWIQQGRIVFHLDTKTDKWENVSRSLSKLGDGLPIRQVFVDDDDAWLVTDSPKTSKDLPTDPSAAPIYRYSSRTGEISPVYPEPGKQLKGKGLVAANGTLYLAATEGVYRLNRVRGYWEPMRSPALPAELPALDPVAAREDANNVWIVGNDSALRYSK